jgi:DNA-binding PadR family transcriptional regulator
MSVRYAVLGLLHYTDMHGYRLKELIDKDFGHMWSINHGQIYQTLKKLEEEGLVTQRDVTPSENGGPQKKPYSITESGRDEFARWLASDPERPMILRDPFLTRFVFFDFGDRESALRIIDEQIEAYRAQLTARREQMPRRRRQGRYVRLVSDLGVTLNEMYLEWLERAREEIALPGKADRAASAVGRKKK